MQINPLLVSTYVYAAAELGTLSGLPAEVLTEEALASIDKDQSYAPIHIAAMFGHLDQIPQERLTPAVMSVPSRDKLNAVHYAAREHHLDQVPKRLLTPVLLGDTAHTDWTPAHEIAACGDIGLMPEASLTKEVLIELAGTRSLAIDEPRKPASPAGTALPRPWMSVIEICIRNGSVAAIPRSALTPEVMNANTCSRAATAMHIVAETGCWNNVPADLVTIETAFLRDSMHETPLHYAAKAGKLRDAPAKLFTRASVMNCSRRGETPLRDAALAGHISQMPSEFLTRGNLSDANKTGKTSYHFAARSGTLADLPPHTLERSDLLRGDSNGVTPLHDAATFKKLSEVPRGIVQSEDLTAVDGRGCSVEAIACFFGCHDQAWALADSCHGPSVLLHSLPADPQVGPSIPTSEWIDRSL
jgi:ankyrin repeat protein